MVDSRFSQRHGYGSHEADIVVREDAPHELRGVLIDICYEHQLSPKSLRSLVCRVLRKRPDENNWSDFPNVDGEIRALIDDAHWYRVYDVIEGVFAHMKEHGHDFDCAQFESDMNSYFKENGIGWQLASGRIEVRGQEAFEKTMKDAAIALSNTEHLTASQELHEAIRDLSRRPKPDITGAIQHSVAALECVAREMCGDPKANLGDLLKKRTDLIPPPLDEGVKKMWGYASEKGRHLREGRRPSFHEAQLVVGVAAAVATYLARQADDQ